jgi:hypothetical protein
MHFTTTPMASFHHYTMQQQQQQNQLEQVCLSPSDTKMSESSSYIRKQQKYFNKKYHFSTLLSKSSNIRRGMRPMRSNVSSVSSKLQKKRRTSYRDSSISSSISSTSTSTVCSYNNINISSSVFELGPKKGR